MSPAEVVIKEAGSLRVLAKKLNLTFQAVSNWKKTGRVPSKWMPTILETYPTITTNEIIFGRPE